VRDAIEKEVERQIVRLKPGGGLNPGRWNGTRIPENYAKMRSKETEADYRYFKEPDLLPIRLDEAWKEAILAGFPELPLARRQRFVDQYGLPEYDAEILTGERNLSDYFEAAVKAFNSDPKKVSNWLMNDVLRMINDGAPPPNCCA